MSSVAAVVAVLAFAGLGVGGASAALRRRFAIITVRGSSMLPSYADGDRLLVRRTAEFGRDDVMVFAMPEDLQVDGMKWLLKRVTAVAGDGVPAEISAAGGRPADVGPAGDAGAGRVPAGCVVVRGDGRASLDSRQLGYIATATGLGVVIRPLRS
jgi:signal peptidase I